MKDSIEERRVRQLRRDLLRLARYALRQHLRYYQVFYVGNGQDVLRTETKKSENIEAHKERLRFHIYEYSSAIRLYLELGGKLPEDLQQIQINTNFPID